MFKASCCISLQGWDNKVPYGATVSGVSNKYHSNVCLPALCYDFDIFTGIGTELKKIRWPVYFLPNDKVSLFSLRASSILHIIRQGRFITTTTTTTWGIPPFRGGGFFLPDHRPICAANFQFPQLMLDLL